MTWRGNRGVNGLRRSGGSICGGQRALCSEMMFEQRRGSRVSCAERRQGGLRPKRVRSLENREEAKNVEQNEEGSEGGRGLTEASACGACNIEGLPLTLRKQGAWHTLPGLRGVTTRVP